MKIALFRFSHRRVPHRTSTKAPYPCRRIHPGRSLCKSLSSRSCRGAWAHGLYIATGQYSSLCVSAVVLTLDGDDIVEVDVPDREQVDCEREKVEVRDKEKGDKTRTNNARSNMCHHGWHVDGVTAHLRHLEPRCECNHMCKVYEKKHV